MYIFYRFTRTSVNAKFLQSLAPTKKAPYGCLFGGRLVFWLRQSSASANKPAPYTTLFCAAAHANLR